ncbi:MAG: bL21 family ribosomal protein, partial [Myxococcota bacterium]
MYAVLESGGKQHRVTEGDLIKVEKIDGEVG